MNIKVKYNSLSILYKMVFLYIVIIITCISILTGIISFNSTNAIRYIAENNAEQLMISTHRSMMTRINDITYMFTSLQANRNLQRALKDTDPQNAVYNVTQIDDILFETDVYGQKISNIKLYALNHPEYDIYSSERVASDKGVKNTSYYNTILENPPVPMWIANDNNYASKSYITALKLLTDSLTDKPLAIIEINIDTTQFVETFQSLHLADTGQMFLCTAGHHIINPYSSEFITRFSHNIDLINLINQNTTDTIYCTINSEDYLLSSYPLSDTGFYLIGAARLSEFTNKALALHRAVIPTIVLMSIIIIFLLYYVSRYITRPVIRLADSMELFSPGTPQIISHNQNDEIGRLYYSFNDMQNRITKLTEDLSESLTIQKKAELKAIQSQITPHFLYNTLNSISSLAQKHNIEEIEYMTSSLATFFTRTLNNGNTFCTIRDELVHIQSYVNIQNIRFSNKVKIVINIPDEMLDLPIINLTLQPLVENCIVHAFKNKTGIGTIEITGKQNGKDVYIDVADDGLGANITDIRHLNQYVNKPFGFDEQIDKYGIHNVNHRIKLYYGNKYGLSYSYNKNDGITATVHISTETD